MVAAVSWGRLAAQDVLCVRCPKHVTTFLKTVVGVVKKKDLKNKYKEMYN